MDTELGDEAKAFILKFESGALTSHFEFVEGFQQLIRTGTVWNLHAMYGRTALSLLESGECMPASWFLRH